MGADGSGAKSARNPEALGSGNPAEYDPGEQGEILDTFRAMLGAATADGGRKRAAGLKVSWKVDPGHRAALYRHLRRWEEGERVDSDSGAHPLVHVAWRALAIAWQERRIGRTPELR